MTTSPAAPTLRPRPGLLVALAVLPQVMIGVVAYFVVFLFAYGFRDEVGVGQHVGFLVGIAVVALGCALVAAILVRSTARAPYRRALGFCVAAAGCAHAVAIAAGVAVSGRYEAQGSVTEGWSAPTYVVVVAALVAVSVASGLAAKRALGRL